MKLIIKSNGKIIKTKTEKSKYGIESVNIDFETCYLYSDLEFWLLDDNGGYLDHLGETPATMSETTREFVEDNNCDLSVLEDKNKAYYLG